MIELFDKGGVVMWVLAVLSIYALGVVLFKCWQFTSEKVWFCPPLDRLMAEIKHGNRAHAKQELMQGQGPQSPVATVMLSSLECVEKPHMSSQHKQAEVMRVGSARLQQLESHMRGLEIAATVAPLLGLLGTVIGLIDSFSKLGIGSARVDPTMLAGGIWSALLTTAAGLTIAIPALAAHAGLDSQLEKLKLRMQDAAVQILALEDAPPLDVPHNTKHAA